MQYSTRRGRVYNFPMGGKKELAGGVLLALAAAVVLNGASCGGAPKQAAAPQSGLFVSEDNGKNWQKKGRYESGADFSGLEPLSFTVDVYDPNKLYIVAGTAGLYASKDRGNTWELAKTPTSSVVAMAIHPVNPNIIFVAGSPAGDTTKSLIWKTFDGGEKWTEVFAEPYGSKVESMNLFRPKKTVVTAVTAIGVDPEKPERVYAGSSSGALIVSDDGGKEWRTMYSFTAGISALKISPFAQGEVFARLSSGELGFYTEKQNTAIRIDIAEKGERPSALLSMEFAYEGGKPIIVAGTEKGLYKSADNGKSWARLALPVSEKQQVAVSSLSQSKSGRIWAGSNFNLYFSDDRGATWKVRQFPLAGPIRFIAADPADEEAIYTYWVSGR